MMISMFLIILAFIYIYKKKSKTKLHYAFMGSFGFLIIWDIGIVLQLFLINKNTNLAMYADFIAYIGTCYLPVTFLFSAIAFANTHINFSGRYGLLFAVPTISLLIIWTNDFHHLFYIKYSIMNNEAILGPYFKIHALYSYGCIFIGLLYFLVFSIRNSGIFSKQAFLILVGCFVPLVVNILYSYKILILSNSWTPILFSFFVLCCFFAISRYNFLDIIPIALRSIVDNISDSFIVLNKDLIIVDYNKALVDICTNEMKIERGYSIIELLASHKLNSIDNTALLREINNVIQNKGTVSFERHIATYGFDKYFTVEISPILSKKGSCMGIIILLKDVTEIRKNLETITKNQAILRKERHDFANHLNTLNAMCLLKKPDTLDRMGNYISKLVNNSNFHYNLPECGNCCIDALLSAKINLANQKSIQFEADFDFLLSDIDIDDVDLISIIGNIIDNAFDAVDMDSQTKQKIVSVYTYTESNKAYISISNNGPKIPNSHLNKIFMNKFSTKSEKEGERGFGLYITKELVTKNRGKIHVTSTEYETEFLLEFIAKEVSRLG